MNRIRKNIFGFTLIELVVAIGLMGILGLIFTDTLIQTLRGQNKVKVLNQVKQNGQMVLDRLSNELRQAEKIICVYDFNASVTQSIVVYKAGTYSKYQFYPPEYPEGCVNGCIKKFEFTIEDIPDAIGIDNDPTDEQLLCSEGINPGDLYSFTDTDPVTGVSLDYADSSTPFFSRDQSVGYSDIVTVSFRAFQAVDTGKTYETSVKEDGVTFTTTVQLRGKI